MRKNKSVVCKNILRDARAIPLEEPAVALLLRQSAALTLVPPGRLWRHQARLELRDILQSGNHLGMRLKT